MGFGNAVLPLLKCCAAFSCMLCAICDSSEPYFFTGCWLGKNLLQTFWDFMLDFAWFSWASMVFGPHAGYQLPDTAGCAAHWLGQPGRAT